MGSTLLIIDIYILLTAPPKKTDRRYTQITKASPKHWQLIRCLKIYICVVTITINFSPTIKNKGATTLM